MAYASVDELIQDVVSFTNDTDAKNYIIPATTKRRVTHYAQRTLEEIWNYRPWGFKMQFTNNFLPNGSMDLPMNFATIGPKGAVIEESNNMVWSEVDMQELIVAQQRTDLKQERLYAIGSAVGWSDPADPDVLLSTTEVSNLQLIVPMGSSETRLFTIYYEGTPPRLAFDQLAPTVQDYTKPVGLPQVFHNVLLLGTIAKVQEAKGDPRPSFRSEYIAALSKVASVTMPLSSRMQQLPRTIPRGKW